MRYASILIFATLLIQLSKVTAAEYPCQDPPYYTIPESILYPYSPSSQMEVMHVLIGIFQSLDLREEGRTSEVATAADPELSRQVHIHDEYFNGVKATVITPNGIRNDQKILYFHGGGYHSEIIIFQWEMALDIAIKAGSPVYVVDYRLAPQYSFPAPIDDGYAVYTKLLESFDSDEIVFMGDSAGGGLSLGLAGRLRDEGLPLPAQLVLISPWLDVACDNPDLPVNDDLDQMLDFPGIQETGLSYVGGNPDLLDHPYASPLLLEDLGDLPPCLLFIGTYEILHPDALLFKAKAEEQGMDLHFVEVNGGFHVWLGAPAWLVPESARSRRQVASFINCYSDGGRLEQEESLPQASAQNLKMQIYPNPGYGDFNLMIDGLPNSDSPQGLFIEIFDITGEQKYHSSHIREYSKCIIPISVELGAGQYLLKVSGENICDLIPLIIR